MFAAAPRAAALVDDQLSGEEEKELQQQKKDGAVDGESARKYLDMHEREN